MRLKIDELRKAQEAVSNFISIELVEPMVSYDAIRSALDIMEQIDNFRRKQWHAEKFGAYEEMAKEVMPAKQEEETFNSDDIPF